MGNNKNIFYHDKPMFGLDIGRGSIKVMQVVPGSINDKGKPKLQGYGTTVFNREAISDGVIKKPEIIAEVLKELFAKNLVGDITTRRVILSIPSYRTLTRTINLPILPTKDMDSAVSAEIANYMPLPLDDMYIDWSVINTTKKDQDLLVVAIPRNVVDSYLVLCRIVDLEPVSVITTMHAATQLINQDKDNDLPTMIIDFGSLSSDINLSIQKEILVMGTVQGGGESFTNAIKKALDVSQDAAGLIKNKYGLGFSKKQAEIEKALKPTLTPITKEIHRMLRYYEDRFKDHKPIGQIVILGGGANMPGLSDYLVSSLRMPVRTLNPWQYINNNRLQEPSSADRSMYSTAAGLALVTPPEVFA